MENHAADCSTNNEPAYPKGKCDCNQQIINIMKKHLKVVGMPKSKAKRFIVDVMNDPVKKAEYLKVIQEHDKATAR